jgi:4-amino-4-deoxy-L-arabinose transferase-like glycosyltransferase
MVDATKHVRSERRSYLLLVALFGLALVMRILFVAWRGPIFSPDSTEYFSLARNLAWHGAFSLESVAPYIPSIRRPPAYPAMLAAFYGAGVTSPTIIVVWQAILDATVSVLVLTLGRFVTSLKWATTAAVFYAVHPGSIWLSANLLSESVFTFLLTSALAALVIGLKRERLWLSTLSGLLFGLAILCRPIAFPVPFLLCGLLILFRQSARPLRQALVLLVVCFLVIAPWIVRSSYVSKHFVFIQGLGAVNLWVPTVLSIDQRDEAQIWAYHAATAQRLAPGGLNTPEQMVAYDRLLFHEALGNIRANPSRYVRARVRTFPYLFISSFDNFTNLNESFGALRANGDLFKLGLKAMLLLVFSLGPFLLALIGAVAGRRNLIAMMCATVWIYTLVIHLPLWIEYRFWIPVTPFLLVSSVIGAQTLVKYLRIHVIEASAQP